MIRVAVLGGNTMIRAGLRALLAADPALEIAEDPEDCDVLILSGTPGAGSDALLDLPLAEPAPCLLVIAEDVEPYRSVLEEGESVFGLLSANATGEEVRAAILSLAAGMLVGSPRLMQAFFGGPRTVAEGLPDSHESSRRELSAREAEVLQLLFLGLVNKEIAARLEISEHTVKFHVSSIFAKLGATNRVEAIRAGIRRGLLEL